MSCTTAAREKENDMPYTVELPCKPGDQVWFLRRFHDTRVPICGTVTELLFTDYWHPLIVVYGVGRGLWGKTVFATKEEALQKGQIK